MFAMFKDFGLFSRNQCAGIQRRIGILVPSRAPMVPENAI